MTPFEQGFFEELEKIAKLTEEEKLLRRAGPAAGATIGGAVGLVRALKKGKGKIPIHLLAGLGAGATLGWLPDITLSAGEALSRYKRKRLAKLLERDKKKSRWRAAE
jgi:hypothetical protein